MTRIRLEHSQIIFNPMDYFGIGSLMEMFESLVDVCCCFSNVNKKVLLL